MLRLVPDKINISSAADRQQKVSAGLYSNSPRIYHTPGSSERKANVKQSAAEESHCTYMHFIMAVTYLDQQQGHNNLSDIDRSDLPE